MTVERDACMHRAKPSSSTQVVAKAIHHETLAQAALVVRAQKLRIAAFPRRDVGFLFYRELQNGNVDVYECSGAELANQYLLDCERFVESTPG